MKATVRMQPDRPIDGRSVRRREAMRRAQDAALTLFAARGYDAVTMEEIARAAGVSPPTLYRGFGTKERVVLWDEYDPMLLAQIDARLGSAPLSSAVLGALIACLDRVYAEDRARILRRARLMLKHPALLAAGSADQAQLQRALAALFVKRKVCRPAYRAEVVAGAMVATLACAARAWVEGQGRRPLAGFLRAGFAHLATI